MIKLLKQLFCKHDYIVYQDHSNYNGIQDKYLEFRKRCAKCGKVKRIK